MHAVQCKKDGEKMKGKNGSGDCMQSLRVHIMHNENPDSRHGEKIIRFPPMISITPSLFLMTFVF
jgi:hypothetical protein